MLIKDGTGSDRSAGVDVGNRLKVRADPGLVRASDLGLAYSWTSGERNIDTTDTMLFIKNTGDSDLYLARAYVSGSDVICRWHFNTGSATTTPSGTAVTGYNLNGSYASRIPDALAYYDETALADGNTIIPIWTPVTNTVTVDLSGIILPKNHYLQVNQITESTSGAITVIGYFAE